MYETTSAVKPGQQHTDHSDEQSGEHGRWIELSAMAAHGDQNGDRRKRDIDPLPHAVAGLPQLLT
jgi:hypothetical protein